MTKASIQTRGLPENDVSQPESPHAMQDYEKGFVDHLQLQNDIVRSYSWNEVTVEVKDRSTKQPLKLLNSVSGHVVAGLSSTVVHFRTLASLTMTERGTVGHHGPERLWKNHAAECAGKSCCHFECRSLEEASNQWLGAAPGRFPQDISVCRARGRVARCPHCTRDYKLRRSSIIAKV